MVRPYLNDISNDEGERYAVYRYYGNSKKMRRLSRERERRKVKNWSSLAKTELFGLMLTGQMGTGVVNAVFVQQTLQVAKGDEEVLFLEKQKAAEEKYFKNVAKIFTKLDTSGDGLLSWGEFEQLLEDPKLRFLLDKLEIAAGDLKVLFDLLDDTGDGEISVEEFIEGVTRFKAPFSEGLSSFVEGLGGAAKSLDVGQVLLRARRMERHIVNVEKSLDRKQPATTVASHAGLGANERVSSAGAMLGLAALPSVLEEFGGSVVLLYFLLYRGPWGLTIAQKRVCVWAVWASLLGGNLGAGRQARLTYLYCGGVGGSDRKRDDVNMTGGFSFADCWM
ncbi:unnamed protein product [Durusdinium trenchii]|uniref:EF-hand domain-containing protein n=1 Tax=Durusdinium trenchii TaxID=1381693 RepID=A0ABP0RLD3_9DINO